MDCSTRHGDVIAGVPGRPAIIAARPGPTQ
jgi:hypothetical protein